MSPGVCIREAIASMLQGIYLEDLAAALKKRIESHSDLLHHAELSRRKILRQERLRDAGHSPQRQQFLSHMAPGRHSRASI